MAKNKINIEMGKRIKELWGKETQLSMAARCKITQGMLSRYQKGIITTPDILLRIADHLGTTMEYLMNGEGQMFSRGENVRDALSPEKQMWWDEILKMSDDEALEALVVRRKTAGAASRERNRNTHDAPSVSTCQRDLALQITIPVKTQQNQYHLNSACPQLSTYKKPLPPKRGFPGQRGGR